MQSPVQNTVVRSWFCCPWRGSGKSLSIPGETKQALLTAELRASGIHHERRSCEISRLPLCMDCLWRSCQSGSSCWQFPCVPLELQRLKPRVVGNSYSTEVPPRGHSPLRTAPSQGLTAKPACWHLRASFTRDLAQFTGGSPGPC